MLERDSDATKERVQFCVPLVGIGGSDDRCRGWIFRVGAVDLLGIEDRVALEKRDLLFTVLALLSPRIGLLIANLDLVGIEHD